MIIKMEQKKLETVKELKQRVAQKFKDLAEKMCPEELQTVEIDTWDEQCGATYFTNYLEGIYYVDEYLWNGQYQFNKTICRFEI